MSQRAVLLHVTDPHLATSGVALQRDDRKVEVAGLEPATREYALEKLFERLPEYLTSESVRLDGVIFSGDAQSRGAPGGHDQVADLILKHLEDFGITPDRVVATPGNHDVPRDTLPSTAERYENFIKAWSARGCVVPWLDGVDRAPVTAPDKHRLVAADRSWAIFPINSSNWSHATSILPPPLSDVWEAIPEAVAAGDEAKSKKIREQLQALARYDMARISHAQLEAVRNVVASTPKPRRGSQLRVAVMHHHLRSPTLREEVKAFADFSNLEQIRAFLRDSKFGVVVHGHKHEHAAYYEALGDGTEMSGNRLLVISGATFEAGRENDAMRLITLEGLPHTPRIVINPLPLTMGGVGWSPGPPINRDLWIEKRAAGSAVVVAPNVPSVIEGTDIEDVYVRACKAAETVQSRSTLLVHLDLDASSCELPFPVSYPFPGSIGQADRPAWLKDLVEWWQRDSSQLAHRLPYAHGGRLRRYGGKIDQIKRIIAILNNKDSSRALAVLVDPFRDFNADGSNENFASFSLVEFRLRDTGLLDAIGFYRAQEFARWWPVNVAELRMLQLEISKQIGKTAGRITTITADARTIARSPTQVGIPIVDRWLDQAPERLHLLADALLYRKIRGPTQASVIQEWRRALDELMYAANEFNSDGVPVAIEGLRILAQYVSVGRDANDDEAKELSDVLNTLADHNEQFEPHAQELGKYKIWASSARRHVERLKLLTTRMVGDNEQTS